MRLVGECEACLVGLYATCGATIFCYHEHAQALVEYPLDYHLATRPGSYLTPPTVPENVIGVDRGVVPLLRSLWAVGVRTWVSCQGDGWRQSGYVSYHIEDQEAAVAFATSVWPERYLKITHTNSQRTGRIAFPAIESPA